MTNFSYTYDANKRKLTETDAVNTNLSQTFAYDFENRLTSWSSNGTTLNQTQSWALSLEGAWNTNTINGNTETRTFNSAYETLTSNSNPMSHDRKGNLTQNKDGSLYSWDFDNQLSFSIAGTPSVNASYAYDALGRRVSKTANNTTTIYVSTGYQIATEYKSVNNSAFSELQSYVYATYVDEPLVLINANGRFYYHNNQQFSVSKLTDGNQNIVESYAYNAYGDLKILTDSSGVDNAYFFTGRQLDSETGLFYFRARYYDAKLGQFISRDPIGYVDGMSLYRGYFAIGGLDPSGRDYDFGHSNDGSWLGSSDFAKAIGSWIGTGTTWPVIKFIDPRNIIFNPTRPSGGGAPIVAPATGSISDPQNNGPNRGQPQEITPVLPGGSEQFHELPINFQTTVDANLSQSINFYFWDGCACWTNSVRYNLAHRITTNYSGSMTIRTVATLSEQPVNQASTIVGDISRMLTATGVMGPAATAGGAVVSGLMGDVSRLTGSNVNVAVSMTGFELSSEVISNTLHAVSNSEPSTSVKIGLSESECRQRGQAAMDQLNNIQQ